MKPTRTHSLTRGLALAALGLMMLAQAPAQAAQEWGLPEEEVARFDAKVVDILCELTGDCPANCGGGTRQLGLLDAEGKLILAIKNFTAFSGAADELIDFCGKVVTADGLFTTNRGYRIFALQFVREAPDGTWQRANRFLVKWAESNGVAADSPEAKQWFRNDPRVKALIEKDGILGLGPDADEAYLKSLE
jgi:hypothetical protein